MSPVKQYLNRKLLFLDVLSKLASNPDISMQ